MVDYIVAVDAGNGFTNAVRAKGKGYESIGFPSVRASVSGDSLGLGEQFEMSVDYVKWSTFRYAIGDDVFQSLRVIGYGCFGQQCIQPRRAQHPMAAQIESVFVHFFGHAIQFNGTVNGFFR